MVKIFLSIGFLALSASLKAQSTARSQSELDTHKINWPFAYEPARSKFYVHNEIEINAKPEKVWTLLIDALKWEQWYEGAKKISFLNHADTVLNENSVFNWHTMGLNFQSTIKQYEPNKLLAWESSKKQIQGYHVWLIVPTANGCKVITDESQNGWLTFFEKTFQRKKLEKLHDKWLIGLKTLAEK